MTFSINFSSSDYDTDFPLLPGLKTSYYIHIYIKTMSGNLIPFTVASNCNNCILYNVVLYHLNSYKEYPDNFVLFRSLNNEVIQNTPFYPRPKENEVFYLFIQPK
jgi:hypothetical protein